MKSKNKYYLILFLLALFLKPVFSFGDEKRKADSLLSVIRLAKNDTSVIYALHNLSWLWHRSKPDTSILLAERAYEMAVKNNHTRLMAAVLRNLSVTFGQKGQREKSNKYRENSLKIAREHHYESIIADCLSDKGLALYYQSDNANALKNVLEGLKLYEKLGLQPGIAKSYLNLSVVLQSQGNYDQAFTYLHKAYGLAKTINRKPDEIAALENIGILHLLYFKHYDSALVYIKQSYRGKKEMNDDVGCTECLNNIGTVFETINQPDSAYFYYRQGYQSALKINDPRLIGGALGNMACIYQVKKEYKHAHMAFDSSAALLRKAAALDLLSQVYGSISNLYEEEGSFKDAIRYYKLQGNLRDTLFNKQTSGQISEMQTKYETEKKDSEIQILNKDKERQKTIIYFIAGIVFILILFAYFVFKAYSQKQKANIIITKQKQEVEKKNEIIEEKNKDIMDSINYAKRIQQSMLPTEKYIGKSINKHNPSN